VNNDIIIIKIQFSHFAGPTGDRPVGALVQSL